MFSVQSNILIAKMTSVTLRVVPKFRGLGLELMKCSVYFALIFTQCQLYHFLPEFKISSVYHVSFLEKTDYL